MAPRCYQMRVAVQVSFFIFETVMVFQTFKNQGEKTLVVEQTYNTQQKFRHLSD